MAPTTRNSESTTPCPVTNNATNNNIEEDASHSAAALDQMNPQELIAHTREREFCKFSEPADSIGGDADLDHLVRTTRAILAMNNEIWMRCKQARQTEKTLTQTFMEGAIFQRIAFQTIEITSSNSQPGTLGFMTTAELKHNDFGLSPPIPQELTDIISLKREGPNSIFPDYDLFFGRSLLLHEDVLMPFLLRLKIHLEWIQVFLGQIDAWLMEPVLYVEFIKEVFDKELIIPTNKEGAAPCMKGCTMKHPAPSSCLVCGEPFSSHRQPSQNYSSNFGGQRSQNDQGHLCAEEMYVARKHGSFMCFSQEPQLLKTCVASGKHTDSFDIAMETDRKRLKMFLEFVSCKC